MEPMDERRRICRCPQAVGLILCGSAGGFAVHGRVAECLMVGLLPATLRPVLMEAAPTTTGVWFPHLCLVLNVIDRLPSIFFSALEALKPAILQILHAQVGGHLRQSGEG